MGGLTVLGPVVEPNWGIRVQFTRRDSRCKLGFGPSLANGDSSALETAPAVVLNGVNAEKYLAFLVVEAIWVTANVTRAVNEEMLHP